MTERRIEEALENIWTSDDESDSARIENLNKKFGAEAATILLDKMCHDGLVTVDGEVANLTAEGKRQAELIIRRHRLAERLLHDVLDISSEKYESSACQFEHYVGDDVVASICTLLGHPNHCPHGRSIPEGDCCRKAHKDINPLVKPLSDMNAGDEGKVVYIASNYHDRMDHIINIGINPGSVVRVHQKMPSFVVQVGESQIALDDNIANNIFVRCKHR